MSAETLRELILAARLELESHAVEDAAFNADCLAAMLLKVKNSQLHGYWQKPADADFRERFARLIERRCSHEPLQYIVGEWSFLDFDVLVGPGVLIPRPETEDVFMAAVQAISLRPFKDAFRFADVGTGSGILGIAMTRRFNGAIGAMVDLSDTALMIARQNLQRFDEIAPRLSLLRCDLLGAFAPSSLQVVISNPPYIVAGDIAGLQPEVSQYEPIMALNGGPSGIDLIEKLVRQSEQVLARGGLLVFEHGHGQRQQLMQMINSSWSLIKAGNDLGNRERYMILERS
ncbi:MAG: peptide chain release factor N(5)-glutamine methyltransferase [Candidatus Riflebacteria bacterium]|jgi:release factor glutamine methyltransferase|nr:peptide chain release factor N(5)-glutamine methyltransferase [Candidatus Riflebacteria bacterium]